MKLVIFDADGTLTPQRASSTADFERRLLPGVAMKCAELRRAGVMLVIASNQSAHRPRSAIDEQIAWTMDAVGAYEFLFATDKLEQKPSPHLLLQAMKIAAITDKRAVLFVGDQETDRQAADAAGVEFAWADEFFY